MHFLPPTFKINYWVARPKCQRLWRTFGDWIYDKEVEVPLNKNRHCANGFTPILQRSNAVKTLTMLHIWWNVHAITDGQSEGRTYGRYEMIYEQTAEPRSAILQVDKRRLAAYFQKYYRCP